MTTSKQQAKLDKATKAVLGLGTLRKGYKRPIVTRKDKDTKYRLDTRKGKLVEVDG